MSEKIRSIGIVCNEPELLRERLLVSGVQILEPTTAQQRSYLNEATIIPTEPHGPTDEELEFIIATSETDIRIQVCRIPHYIGETALRLYGQPIDQTIAPGIHGTYLDTRHDAQDELSVSVDTSKVNSLTNKPPKVGLHIDNWPNADTQLLIGNLGPGARYHCLAPSVTREIIGGPRAPKRLPYVRHKLATNPEELRLYWIRLNGPSALGHQAIEACLNVPVARALHDGSTWGESESSLAIFCTIEPVAEGIYPSVFEQHSLYDTSGRV